MNFYDAILTYRMDVITAIKNRWIKFIILNVDITISVQKNYKDTAKNRSKANTDGSSTATAARSGCFTNIFFA